MPSSEKIAIAAHLHVLLRRKTGRVTDTEWMASNQEYALEIARFAREKATESAHADLALWADKLEVIMATPDAKPRVPLVRLMADAVRDLGMPAVAAAASGQNMPDRQSARSVDTQKATFPESGFIDSTFGYFLGEGDPQRKPPREQPAQYVKGLR